MRHLVFVHGRSQEHKDSIALKAEWIGAWKRGLEKSGLRLPVGEEQIHFPYYGQTLYDLLKDVPADKVAEIVVRGERADKAQQQFVRSIIDEIARKAGVTDEQLAEAAGHDVVERGPRDWKWFHGLLQVIDQRIPMASGEAIAMFTNDVYHYLKNPGIRDEIEMGVRKAMVPRAPNVVVGHSLGSVVAYSLLKREGVAQKWSVPIFVTIGSPLAVTEIFKSLRPVKHPECAAKWYNAMDSRDVVALYPLDKDHFDVDPSIENKIDVKNETPNRHGISGYLSDKDVARHIYDALGE